MNFLRFPPAFWSIATCVLFVACVVLTIIVIDKHNQIKLSYSDGWYKGAEVGIQLTYQEMALEIQSAYDDGYYKGKFDAYYSSQYSGSSSSSTGYPQISRQDIEIAIEKALEDYFGS